MHTQGVVYHSERGLSTAEVIKTTPSGFLTHWSSRSFQSPPSRRIALALRNSNSRGSVGCSPSCQGGQKYHSQQEPRTQRACACVWEEPGLSLLLAEASALESPGSSLRSSRALWHLVVSGSGCTSCGRPQLALLGLVVRSLAVSLVRFHLRFVIAFNRPSNNSPKLGLGTNQGTRILWHALGQCIRVPSSALVT